LKTKYDIVIVGASLDGLIAASYLAKSGRSVAVIESAEEAGGLHRTVEIAPGFNCPGAIDCINELHPSIATDLNLASHGLKVIEGGSLSLIDTKGLALSLGADGIEFSREEIDGEDSQEFQELKLFVLEISQALKPALTQALADPTIDRFSGLADLMHLGWALRRLGSQNMPEALRLLPMNVRDLMDERFRSMAMKTLVAAETLRGTRMAPRSDGSVLGLIHRSSFWAGGPGGTIRVAEGGPGALTESLVRAAVAAGAEIHLGTEVVSVDIATDEVTGVRLANGTKIETPTVISTLDPKSTLLELAGPKWLDPDFVEKATQIRGRGALSIVRFAIDRLPRVKGAADSESALGGRLFFANEIDDIERAHDATKYGEFPSKPFLSATFPSVNDPSLAPDGQHVVNVWVHFTPFDLRESAWSHQRGRLLEQVKSQLEESMPGFSESIVHSQVLTPEDLASEFNAPKGCFEQVELSLDQVLYMRPIPGWFKYRTPLKGLFMCGPGTHPGGQSGLSGKILAAELG